MHRVYREWPQDATPKTIRLDGFFVADKVTVGTWKRERKDP
jgi:hypothetical protein